MSFGAIYAEEIDGLTLMCNSFGTSQFGTGYPVSLFSNILDVRIRRGAANLIIGTDGDGINDELEGNFFDSPEGLKIEHSDTARISGNVFGSNVPDLGSGIGLWQTRNVLIGIDPTSIRPEHGNVFLGTSGISIGGGDTLDTFVYGNWLGLTPDGTDQSGAYGIHVTGGFNTRIGRWDPQLDPRHYLANRIIDPAYGISTAFGGSEFDALVEGNYFSSPPTTFWRTGYLPRHQYGQGYGTDNDSP